MKSKTSKKQSQAVDPVSRFRWALSFPGISPAAGKVLAALADHADQSKLTCWPSVGTLVRETQVSERGVQCALRSLEAAGAILTKQSRGRTSSVYRLMIPLNGGNSPPFNGARIAPNPAESAPFNPAESAPQPRRICTVQPRRICTLTEPALEQSKEQSKQQQREPRENQTNAAAPESFINETADKRHVCPECEHTWPKQFGTTCYKCQCDLALARSRKERLAELDAEEAAERLAGLNAEEAEEATPPDPTPDEPPISQTAWRLSGALGGQLPESWLHHQNLKRLIGDRDFKQVCDIMAEIGSNKLPEPAPFFEAYDQHLQAYEQIEAELNAELMALTARFPTPKPVNNGNGKRRAA